MRGDSTTRTGLDPAVSQPSPSGGVAAEPWTSTSFTPPLAVIQRAVDALTNLDLDEVTVHDCEVAYAEIEQVSRRLKAIQTTIFTSMQRRRVELVSHLRPDDPRAGQKAKRKLVDDLQRRTRQTPSEVIQIDRAAQQLDAASSPTREAFVAGDITARHLQLLGETLRDADPSSSSDLEAELLAIARDVDTREFAKACQRRLAQRDYAKAVDAQNARHQRRGLRVSFGDDGMLHISGRLAGVDAELAATAINHFRQPDPAGTPGEAMRTSEQMTADAFTQLCDVALRHTDETRHGHPPQMLITVDYQTLLSEAGIAEGSHVGPLPFDEIRRLLADAGVARILTDAKGLPLEASESVRTVPQGLWRALMVRDGGCVADGCSAPAAWCDVAHLKVPYRLGGRLSLANAALACRRHHRDLDLNGWTTTWIDGRPVIHHPRQQPHPHTSRHGEREVAKSGGHHPRDSHPPGSPQGSRSSKRQHRTTGPPASTGADPPCTVADPPCTAAEPPHVATRPTARHVYAPPSTASPQLFAATEAERNDH